MSTLHSSSSRHARPRHVATRATGGAAAPPAPRNGTTSAADAVSTTPKTSAAPAAPTGSGHAALPRRDVPAAEGGSPAERWRAFARGFVHAGHGVWHAVMTQRNMRVHVLLACLAIALGIALRISPVEFALVFIAVMLVFGTEMLNTVVETVVDMITQEYHPLARIAKDVAAGAVLLNAILAVIIALFVYVPHLWRLIAR